MPPAEVWAGDVVVIGGGVTGALLSRELAVDRSVLLIDQGGYGAGQSNHSHGYLHQGYIYISGATGLIRSLGQGATRWREILHAAGCKPVTPGSTVAFTDQLSVAAARALWSRASLPIRSGPPPAGFDGRTFAACFSTAEPSYDFTGLLQALQEDLVGVPQMRARLRRIRIQGGEVTGVEVQHAADRTRLLLRARAYVLAAGASNIGLLHQATRYRGRAISRMSFMLVAAGEHLPPTSLILPGNTHYGLFVVSRPRDGGGNVWLISNFVSMAHDGYNRSARRLWLKSMLGTIGPIAPVLRDADVRWALYNAPKGELRDSPGTMKGHGWEGFGLPNLFVLAPTKLTLAPLLADDVAHELRSRLGAAPRTDGEIAVEILPVLPERWRRERMLPIQRLCLNEECPAAAQAVWSLSPLAAA